MNIIQKILCSDCSDNAEQQSDIVISNQREERLFVQALINFPNSLFLILCCVISEYITAVYRTFLQSLIDRRSESAL